MSESEAEAVPRGDVLDTLQPQQMIEHLRRAIPECVDGTLDLVSARLSDLRYTPDVECAGFYKLRFQRRADGSNTSQAVAVHFPVAGGKPQAIDAAMARRYGQREKIILQHPEFEIPELGALAHPYPIDLRLRGLIDALDRRVVKPWLARVFKHQGLSLQHVQPRLVSYKLGSRATIRYALRLRDSNGEQSALSVIGKLNANKPLATIMADNLAVWRETEGKFCQAKPLGVIQSIGLSLQSFVPGRRLGDVLQRPEIGEIFATIGRSLGAIHNANVPVSRIRDPRREIRSLDNRCKVLADVVSDPDRVTALRDRLAESIERWAVTCAPIHGDFHHANVMVGKTDVSLIDFDEMGLGDPATDVGRFIVSMSIPSLRKYRDLRLCDLARERFLGGYLEVADIDPVRRNMFEAAAWITSAVTAFRLQRAGWTQDVELLLGRAEEHAAMIPQRPDRSTKNDRSEPRASLDDRFRWMRDRDYMQLHLKALGLATFYGEVTDTTCKATKTRGGEVVTDIRFRTRGSGRAARRRGVAISYEGLNPRRAMRAMNQIIEISSKDLAALRIPLPLGSSQMLGMLIFERIAGAKMSRLVRRGDAEAVSRLATGLAELQGLSVQLPTRRTLSHYVGQIRAGLAGSEKLARLCEELDAVATQLDLAVATVPSIDNPRLEDFLRTNRAVALVRPDALVDAPPLVAAAILAARASATSARAGKRFRAAYVAASGASEEVFSSYERLARLQLAIEKTWPRG